MSWITIDEARANLKMWLDAERAVASGQSYKIGTRSLTRASLSDIAARIKYWRNEIDKLEKNIAMLKAYKMGLVDRYNYLATSPTREKILLQRVKKYGGKVAYYIIFYSVNLTDGHEVEKDRLTFAGSERRQAFKKFEELAK